MRVSELCVDNEPRLKELFPRRTLQLICDFPAIKGPYGYIRCDQTKLGVVVDITSGKIQRRTEKILGEDHPVTLTNDGEYLFRLDFSDTNRALALIGLRAQRD